MIEYNIDFQKRFEHFEDLSITKSCAKITSQDGSRHRVSARNTVYFKCIKNARDRLTARNVQVR